MPKIVRPLKELTFRLVDGAWREVRIFDYWLADFLAEYNLYFDERVQFARIVDYSHGVYILYRVHNTEKITVTLWPIN